MKHSAAIIKAALLPALVILLVLLPGLTATAQRHITPTVPSQPGVATPKPDEGRQSLRNVARYLDENGNEVLVDTITGTEIIDSVGISIPRMLYPTVNGVSIGVNIWDAAMRLFGQKYGIVDFSGTVAFHNRYFAVFEAGLGTCRDTPSGNNYTFRSPIAPYFKIGGDYNIFYNNSPAYQLRAMLRYGFSAFRWSVDDVTLDNSYWGPPATFSIPPRSTTAGWLEVGLNIHVKIVGPLSMGWAVKFHKILHESNCPDGKPMVIPGFGKRTGAITGAFSIYYTLNLNSDKIIEPPAKKKK